MVVSQFFPSRFLFHFLSPPKPFPAPSQLCGLAKNTVLFDLMRLAWSKYPSALWHKSAHSKKKKKESGITTAFILFLVHLCLYTFI